MPPVLMAETKAPDWSNRTMNPSGSLALLILLAGITGTTWGLLHADRNRRKAEHALAAETAARQAEKQARNQALAVLRSLTDEIVQMKKDADLDALRQREDFQQLLKELERN